MNNPFEAASLQEQPTQQNFDEACYLAVNPDVAEAVRNGGFSSGWAHYRACGQAEGRRQKVSDDEIVTAANFCESAYLERNLDVRRAIDAGQFATAREHFDAVGVYESRRQARQTVIPAIRARKLVALRPLLRDPDAPMTATGKYDFLDDATRQAQRLVGEIPVSENGYDDETVRLIEQAADGLVLDVGAGARPVYYSNVVNVEVVDYPTTDVIAVGDALPFKDNCFDGVLSIAVLEHVRDPALCARELSRVLKPGGWLKCCVPFLQPLHGYPHHYFNMTHEGLRSLFEPHLAIERQEVNPATHPIWAIAWQLRSWSQGLPNHARKDFLRMRVADLVAFPGAHMDKSWVRDLSEEKQFELAAATILVARKPASPQQ